MMVFVGVNGSIPHFLLRASKTTTQTFPACFRLCQTQIVTYQIPKPTGKLLEGFCSAKVWGGWGVGMAPVDTDK